LLVLLSCRSQKEKTTTNTQTQQNKITKDLVISTNDVINRNDVTIEGAIIQNDSIIFSLAYSGGCEEHSFELYSNGMMAKSMPPQIYLTLIHLGNQDKCRNLIRTSESFSLKNLSELHQNKMLLRIKDYDQPLLYQPSNTNR
jgi:hypothetical protein